MSSTGTVPANAAVESKVAKVRKSKKADKAGPAVESPAKVDPGSADAPKKPAAVRRPRFDPYIPSNFLNLQDVWTYRASQRRSLQKMRARADAASNDVERAKILVNVRRNEQNLQQLEENTREVLTRINLLGDLIKAGVKLDATALSALSESANLLGGSLATRSSVTVPESE